MYRFVLLKLFGQLLEYFLVNFIFLKRFNSDFSYIKLWFTDRNSKPLEIENRIAYIKPSNDTDINLDDIHYKTRY